MPANTISTHRMNRCFIAISTALSNPAHPWRNLGVRLNRDRQQCADDADDEGAEERGPEAADVKSQTKRRRKRAREPQHQAVDDERKQAEREENQRKGKNFRERPQR